MKIKMFFLTLIVIALLAPTTSTSVMAQSQIAVINASGQGGLSPCTYTSLYGRITNARPTVATNTTTNLLGGYRVQIEAGVVKYLATITYVGDVTNGQVNFILPCDKSLANNNVIVRLLQQQPANSTFLDAGSTQVSLEEYTPGMFTIANRVLLGTYFQREHGVDSYPPMVITLPDGTPGPAELALNPNIDQGVIAYATGGTYPPSISYLPTVRIGGLDGLASVIYFGSPDPANPLAGYQQLNIILNSKKIIDAGLINQFVKVEIIVNGRVIGTGFLRFKKA